MVNIKMLRAKMLEKNISVEGLATIIGINKATLYRRLNNGAEDMSIKEAVNIANALTLNAQEVTNIFFASFVA